MIHNNDNEFQLCLEDELLLCCSRTKVDDQTRKKIKSLTCSSLDWEHIIEMATRHRLIPLLYINLNSISPENVPEDVLANLKEEFHNNARKNLLLTGELVKIMNLLKENDINAIPYKGPVLANLVYGNSGYRQYGDVDILIDGSDALIVKEIMILAGYELYHPISIDDSYYIKFVTEHQFINKDNGVIIEIKWKFEGDFFTFPTKPLFLFENLEIVDIDGLEINNFDKINHIIILCIHAAKHGWMRLSWMGDIAAFLNGKDIDWFNVIKKSEKLGVKKILLINLNLARKLLGLEIPNSILVYIDSDSSVNDISLWVLNKIFVEQREKLNLFENFFLYLKMRDSLIYGFKDCISGLTKPGYKDFENISMPEIFFPLYKIFRPFLLLKRYGKDQVN
jgi:hypothetical protein